MRYRTLGPTIGLCGALVAPALAGTPTNDECTGAIEIFNGDTPFDTFGASTSLPELPLDCDKGFGTALVNDIWFSYTATQDGVLTVFTCNQASFDTRLAAYMDGCADPTLIACNDDGVGCAGLTSLMEIGVTEGTELLIRLGGFAVSGSGTLTLTYDGFQFECPASDHDCFSTGAPGCTDVECCATVCSADAFCCSVAWDSVCVSEAFSFCPPPACKFTCPEGASLEDEACGDDTNGGCNQAIGGDSNCCVANGGLGCDDPACMDAVCSIDQFCCSVAWDSICAGEAFSFCPDLCTLLPPQFSAIACGETICGTAWATGGVRDTDWYEIKIGRITEVTFSIVNQMPMVIGVVDTGGTPDCALATQLNPFASSGFCGSASFTACLEPGTYWFFAGPGTFDGFPCGGEFNEYSITLDCGGECIPPGPVNDDCANAIDAFDGPNVFSMVDSSTDGPPLPPECDKGFGLGFVNDIWYHYTATNTDTVTISTCNAASYDTRLALYTGPCEALNLVACNDDGPGCSGFTSVLEASVIEGETYLIRLGGFAAEGTGVMTISYGAVGVPNDACADAIPVGDGNTTFSTVGATTDGPALPAECDEGFALTLVNDIWYAYTTTCTGTVTVSTCGMATYDTRLAAYTGSCDDLTLVGCNDDGAGCTGFTSIMTFPATCGTTYLIRVGGFSASGGGTFNIACAGSPCGAPCPGDLNGDGQVDGADLGALLGTWGLPGAGDINGSGTTDGADLGILLGAWGDCP